MNGKIANNDHKCPNCEEKRTVEAKACIACGGYYPGDCICDNCCCDGCLVVKEQYKEQFGWA